MNLSLKKYLINKIQLQFLSFQDFILEHYSETPENYEKELELFENLRKVCPILLLTNKISSCPLWQPLFQLTTLQCTCARVMTGDHKTECFRRLCVRPAEMKQVFMLCICTTINCTLWRGNFFPRERDTSCRFTSIGK